MYPIQANAPFICTETKELFSTSSFFSTSVICDSLAEIGSVFTKIKYELKLFLCLFIHYPLTFLFLSGEIRNKKSARFAGTFSLRAARFARKFDRAQAAQFNRRASRSVFSGPRASRSVLCSSHTFKFISYNLILKHKPI